MVEVTEDLGEQRFSPFELHRRMESCEQTASKAGGGGGCMRLVAVEAGGACGQI